MSSLVRHHNQQQHWEGIFTSKELEKVSWYRTDAGLSYELISKITGSLKAENVSMIDVGAGANPILIEQCSRELPHRMNITVLDISQVAIDTMREKLGNRRDEVNFLVGNACDSSVFTGLDGKVDIVHDRAVFHFLTDPIDRELYLQNMHRLLKEGGHLILGTFALPDGPIQCSGIPIVRYDDLSLKNELIKYFELVETKHEMHETPSQSKQHFVFGHFTKRSL